MSVLYYQENVQQFSLTISVIDFCLTKNLVTDTTTNFTSLQMEWCSRSNCRQRAGRTGRTRDGRVYRLVPKYFYEVKTSWNRQVVKLVISKMLSLLSASC